MKKMKAHTTRYNPRRVQLTYRLQKTEEAELLCCIVWPIYLRSHLATGTSRRSSHARNKMPTMEILIQPKARSKKFSTQDAFLTCLVCV
jgi:hypothetical protein